MWTCMYIINVLFGYVDKCVCVKVLYVYITYRKYTILGPLIVSVYKSIPYLSSRSYLITGFTVFRLSLEDISRIYSRKKIYIHISEHKKKTFNQMEFL